ncbi:MAG TPA: M23 family metallopeptidase [Candidatus Limnocylindria bacterium]|nr:M23 family metallopeptidase [Candidatus Limnocylindria bacterium]
MRRSIRAIGAALIVALVLPVAVLASWPVANRSSYVSQGYHSYHKADDIASYSGTRVVPMRSGKVVFAGWKSNCGGYQVWVSHGNGLYSAYYHLRSEAVSKGQAVTRQETTLGRVGESGCASGPHLHMEVWRGYPWASGSYRVRPWSYIDSGYYLPYRYR